MRSTQKKHDWQGYIFILPLLIILGIFLFFSIGFMFKTSFFKVDLTFTEGTFVGWKNYRIAFHDKYLFRAIVNTIIFAAASVFFGVTAGFLFSVFLCFKFTGVRFFRTLFFVPTLLPNAMIAAVFAGMLQYNYGTLNEVLKFFHLNFLAQRWLSDPTLAYCAVLMIGLYLIGMPMMYYTAELSTISQSMYEAATMDGANFWQITISVIFPTVVYSHKTIFLTMMLLSFREFERVYLLTWGGPGHATEISGTYLYDFFTEGASNVGYVSAISIIVLIVALVLAVIELKFFERRTA